MQVEDDALPHVVFVFVIFGGLAMIFREVRYSFPDLMPAV